MYRVFLCLCKQTTLQDEQIKMFNNIKTYLSRPIFEKSRTSKSISFGIVFIYETYMGFRGLVGESCA